MDNVHWLLGRTRPKGENDIQVILIDSMECGNAIIIEEKLLDSFNAFKEETGSKSEIEISLQPSIQQFNSFSCADHVISNVMAICMGRDQNMICENTTLRKQIAILMSAEDDDE